MSQQGPTKEQLERVAICIGDHQRHHLRAQRTWQDSIDLAVSNGVSSMSRRLFPEDMRRLAKWLNESANRIDKGEWP